MSMNTIDHRHRHTWLRLFRKKRPHNLKGRTVKGKILEVARCFLFEFDTPRIAGSSIVPSIFLGKFALFGDRCILPPRSSPSYRSLFREIPPHSQAQFHR